MKKAIHVLTSKKSVKSILSILLVMLLLWTTVPPIKVAAAPQVTQVTNIEVPIYIGSGSVYADFLTIYVMRDPQTGSPVYCTRKGYSLPSSSFELQESTLNANPLLFYRLNYIYENYSSTATGTLPYTSPNSYGYSYTAIQNYYGFIVNQLAIWMILGEMGYNSGTLQGGTYNGYSLYDAYNNGSIDTYTQAEYLSAMAAAASVPDYTARTQLESRAVAKRAASVILYAASQRCAAAMSLSGSYTLPNIVCTASLTNQSGWSWDTTYSCYTATIQANVTNGGTWIVDSATNCVCDHTSGASGEVIRIFASYDQMKAWPTISVRALAPDPSQTGAPRQLALFTSNGQSFVDMDFPPSTGHPVNASATWTPTEVDHYVYKRDAITTTGLGGAYLRVFSDALCTNIVYEGTTAADGSLLLSDIADGTFWFAEISPPPGYAHDPTVRTFTIAGGVFVGGSMTLYDFVLDITISKTAVSGTPLEGATIGVYTDAACTSLYTSGITDSAGHFTISGIADGTYYYRELVAPSGYNLNPNIFSFTVAAGVVSGLTTIVDAPYPDVTLRKYDAADPAVGVPGATFGVYTDAACTVLYGTYVSDSNGEITLTDVADATYYWREEIAPAGYILDSTVYSFVVTGGVVSGSTSMSNTRMPNVILTKRGSDTMAGVPGATIGVYTDATCTTLYGTYTTDSNGEVLLVSVPDNTYYWRETAAPANYNLDPTVYSFVVSSGLVSGTTSFVNIRMPDIELLKTDEQGNPVAGTTFTVYRDAALTDVLASGVTGTDGNFRINGVPDATYYYWMETAATPGYLPDATVHTISVVNGVVSGTLSMRNTETRVLLWKQDAVTTNLLAGARFIIYDESNTQVAEGTTGADGSVTFTRLPIGTYHFVEVEAPDTYLINPDTFTFTLNPDGSISGTTLVANNRQPIELTIHKNKESGVWNPNTNQYDIAIVPAEGIVFSVYAGSQIVDSEGNVIYDADDLVETIATDINGIARTTADLYYGSYYAIETGNTPDVILDSTRYDLVLTQPDQTSNPIVFDFNAGDPVLNHSINAYMQIYKVAGDTTLPLEGVSFEVYDASGTLVDSLVSDASGHATTKLLPYGNYTLIETQTVTGYALADQQDFSIYLAPTAGVPATQELTVVNNKIQAYMQIYKVAGDTTLPLAGVKFEVYDASGVLVDSLVTDATGHATTKLLTYGNYTLIETETVTGYAIADQQDFSIYLSPTAGVPATQQMTVVNYKKAIIEVFKVSEDWQAPLSGVTFGVYTDAGILVQTMVTNDLGIASCTLPKGDYYLQEIATLTGYILDPTKYDVDADWAGVYKYSLSNQMTQLIVEKRSTTGQTLEGMGFTITDASGAIVPIEWNATIGAYVVVHVLGANSTAPAAVPNTVAHTGKNGTATILGLLPGSYIITEVEAPKGYLLDSVPITVTVSAEVGAAAQIGTLINTPKITKTGETGSFWTPEIILGVCLITAAMGMIALVVISRKKKEEEKK